MHVCFAHEQQSEVTWLLLAALTIIMQSCISPPCQLSRSAAAAESTLMLMCSLQALKVLKEMQQRKAFMSLLGVSLAEASKTNDKAQAAQMRSLDLSMHIAAGTLPDAWVVGHQVSEPCLASYITSSTCTMYSARQTTWCCHPLSYNNDVQDGGNTSHIVIAECNACGHL